MNLNPNEFQRRDQSLVGRTDEREWVWRWLQAPRPATMWLVVTGPAGLGKSTFLQWLASIRRPDLRVVWLDARITGKTPVDVLRALGPLTTRLLNGRRALGHEKLIVAIDNFEAWADIGDWMEERFRHVVPVHQILIVAAARTNPLAHWERDPFLSAHFREFRLEAFDVHETAAFLSARGLTPERVEDAYQITHGNPLMLAVLADIWPSWEKSVPAERSQWLLEPFIERVFREIPNDAIYECVDALSLVLDVPLSTLEAILGRAIPAAEVQQLKRLSFVRETADRLVSLHDAVHDFFRQDFFWREPDTYRRMQNRAAAILLEEWYRSPPARQVRIAESLLGIVRDRLQHASSYADLAAPRHDVILTGYRPEDLQDLPALLTNWGRQSLPLEPAASVALLTRLGALFPEMIRVVRNTEGRALALHASVWLYRETLELLAEFSPGFVRQLLQSPLGITACEREKADTLLSVAVGLSPLDGLSRRDLIGLIIRHTLSLHFGRRALVLAQNPALKTLLASLGFEPYPFPVTHADASEVLYALDWRGERVIHWVQQMVGLDRAGFSWTQLTDDDVISALRALPDRRRLTYSRFCLLYGLTAVEAEAWLRQGIQALKNHSRSTTPGALLEYAYLRSPRDSRTVEETFHISRATYYRRLQQATGQLAAWLRMHPPSSSQPT
ncbi:hypothetical protein Sulac_2096 [Sulfobacillus acidophilus DSM 10332]|uniref:Uncharacterized protein n=1 Tax=Sulfobacillus acidophilus (strain ATCC 700253 / DSM 10332 / NAL) TaxID=679936 RepID=G8TSW7_SULAD|nr:hypothetical protein Sulac_2096 [Sulfobacillus acidophilus DSM 10332]